MATGVNSNDTVVVNGTSILNVNMTNITKLSASNYLMWSRQIHSLLDGYGLALFLDSSATSPPPTVTTDALTTPNPDYITWQRQDKLIFSALIGTISIAIQPILSRAVTSADVWEILATTYATPSRGHIKQLQFQLKNWQKGSKTVDEYMQGIVTKFDQLALLGKVIDHEDQIDHVLSGLPDEYKSVVDQTNGRDVPPTLPALHEKLRNHEATLLSTPAPPNIEPVLNQTLIDPLYVV